MNQTPPHVVSRATTIWTPEIHLPTPVRSYLARMQMEAIRATGVGKWISDVQMVVYVRWRLIHLYRKA